MKKRWGSRRTILSSYIISHFQQLREIRVATVAGGAPVLTSYIAASAMCARENSSQSSFPGACLLTTDTCHLKPGTRFKNSSRCSGVNPCRTSLLRLTTPCPLLNLGEEFALPCSPEEGAGGGAVARQTITLEFGNVRLHLTLMANGGQRQAGCRSLLIVSGAPEGCRRQRISWGPSHPSRGRCVGSPHPCRSRMWFGWQTGG